MIPYYHIIYNHIYICSCVASAVASDIDDIPYDIASLETQAAGKSAITWRFRGRIMGDQSSNGTTTYWFHVFGMMPFVATVHILSHTHIYIYIYIHLYIIIYCIVTVFRLVYILSQLSETKKSQNVVQTSYWSILYLTYLDPLKSMA